MPTIIKKVTYPTKELFETIKSFYLGLQMDEHEFEPRRDVTKEQVGLMFNEYIKASKEDSTYEYYMAFTNGIPSGFIEFAAETEIENVSKKYLRINSIYVDDKFRNQGVATELLNVAEKRAKELDYVYIGLGVLSQNSPAINLYKKFGFGEYGIELMKSLE